MCCFSGQVRSVANTRIYARTELRDRQFLAYSMQYKADKELAMILPLPVKKGAEEGDVHFINLEEYANFFDDLETGFPVEVKRGPPAAAPHPLPAVPAPALEVVSVGSFEASFVPTLRDFNRLDPRFVLPVGIWNAIPTYRNYGFAVFKLKPDVVKTHPMAFSFPRLDATRLFFPTVHIHDGKMHPKGEFDHVLYCQKMNSESFNLKAWRESPELAKAFVKVPKSQGMVQGEQHCYRRAMSGELTNADTWVSA